jgi:hypothetical protein
MNTHPYLRAYMAGTLVPTLVLPLILAVFTALRLTHGEPFPLERFPLERFLVFPFALVPTLFGTWNILYLWSHPRTHLPIGLHGAVLPLFGAPIGALVASCLGLIQFGSHSVTYFQTIVVPYAILPLFIVAAMAGYYLVWKYIVGSLNRVLGIA